MMTQSPVLPVRRAELQLSPWGTDGAGIAKNRSTGEYFKLGPIEFFLLSHLDGSLGVPGICAAYERRFSEPLALDFLEDYLEFAQQRGWLGRPIPSGATAPQPAIPPVSPPREATEHQPAPRGISDPAEQNPLFFRFKLLDPDRLLTRMEPCLRPVWSWAFVALSLIAMISAGVILWGNRAEFHSDFTGALHWQTLLVVWLVIVVVTILHEFAHGLTCKHFGGEVHEMGFLMMMGLPCLYCNVSDAWLFPEKWKRIVVTLAGAWFDLCLLATAILLWRISVPESLFNYVATVVVSVVGVRCFVNLSPLFKLDGYYLVTDWLDAPNLYQRGRVALQDRVRGTLWGDPPLAPKATRSVAVYGFFSWLMSALMMAGLGLAVYRLLGTSWAVAGVAGSFALGIAYRQMFTGFEPMSTSADRRAWSRTRRWLVVLGIVTAILCVPVPDLIHGEFELRPNQRVQVRAPVAGFIKSVGYDEGQRLSPGAVLARLDIPDLDSRLAQKQAELEEAGARLKLLEAGPRGEELEWQRQKVASARTRLETARQRLDRARREEAEETRRLEQKISQHQAQWDASRDAYRRALALHRSGVLAPESLTETEKRMQSLEALLNQSRAELEAHKVTAARAAEDEVTLREQELAEAEAELEYVEAGSRPEEIDAERARAARIREELAYLRDVRSRLEIATRSAGVITTPHLKEKIGQYVREGDLICEIEDTSSFEAEVRVSEDDLARIRPDQPLRIKVRAMPFESFDTTIDRIAPRASRDEAHSQAVVTCRVRDTTNRLRPGMTGSARIDGGWKPLGPLVLERSTHFLRNEFWWW